VSRSRQLLEDRAESLREGEVKDFILKVGSAPLSWHKPVFIERFGRTLWSIVDCQYGVNLLLEVVVVGPCFSVAWALSEHSDFERLKDEEGRLYWLAPSLEDAQLKAKRMVEKAWRRRRALGEGEVKDFILSLGATGGLRWRAPIVDRDERGFAYRWIWRTNPSGTVLSLDKDGKWYSADATTPAWHGVWKHLADESGASVWQALTVTDAELKAKEMLQRALRKGVNEGEVKDFILKAASKRLSWSVVIPEYANTGSFINRWTWEDPKHRLILHLTHEGAAQYSVELMRYGKEPFAKSLSDENGMKVWRSDRFGAACKKAQRMAERFWQTKFESKSDSPREFLRSLAVYKPSFNRFYNAYVEVALWSSTSDDGTPLDEVEAEFSAETEDKMKSDCLRFYRTNEEDIGLEQERAGQDFWLTRNRHGAGFWDGDWDEDVGERLTKAAYAFGETALYLGDDGLIYST
jgi:hypothetical protein